MDLNERLAEIAKKITEDEEYRVFLINGVPQKYKWKFYNFAEVYKQRDSQFPSGWEKHDDFDIVNTNHYIARDDDFNGIHPSIEGCLVYRYENKDRGYLKKPWFATIHHPDYKDYFENIDKINSIMLRNQKCKYQDNKFYFAKNNPSEFKILNPEFHCDKNFTIQFQSLINESNHHTGELKVALKFSSENPQNEEMIEGYKMVEFELASLKSGCGYSDIKKTCPVLEDPNSGEYYVNLEIYELCEDDTWHLSGYYSFNKKHKWYSRKELMAYKLLNNPECVNAFSDEDQIFYKQNQYQIEILMNELDKKNREEQQNLENSKNEENYRQQKEIDKKTQQKNDCAEIESVSLQLKKSIIHFEMSVDEKKEISELMELILAIESKIGQLESKNAVIAIADYKPLIVDAFNHCKSEYQCTPTLLRHMDLILTKLNSNHLER